MSVSKEAAGQRAGQVDRPELFALIKEGLQKFVTACATAGFALPMNIELQDAEDDVLRKFTVEQNRKIAMGRCADEEKLYIFPLMALATDARGRVAILKLDAHAVEAVEFVN